jgi:hypothetical protein
MNSGNREDNTASNPNLGRHTITNYYLCPNESWMWTDDWHCEIDDRCPRCGTEVSPCALRDNLNGRIMISAPEDFERMAATNFGYPD